MLSNEMRKFGKVALPTENLTSQVSFCHFPVEVRRNCPFEFPANCNVRLRATETLYPDTQDVLIVFCWIEAKYLHEKNFDLHNIRDVSVLIVVLNIDS